MHPDLIYGWVLELLNSCLIFHGLVVLNDILGDFAEVDHELLGLVERPHDLQLRQKLVYLTGRDVQRLQQLDHEVRDQVHDRLWLVLLELLILLLFKWHLLAILDGSLANLGQLIAHTAEHIRISGVLVH